MAEILRAEFVKYTGNDTVGLTLTAGTPIVVPEADDKLVSGSCVVLTSPVLADKTAASVTAVVIDQAPEYDATETYAVGDLAYLDGVIYECLKEATGKNPKTEATYWDEADVDPVELVPGTHFIVAEDALATDDFVVVYPIDDKDYAEIKQNIDDSYYVVEGE